MKTEFIQHLTTPQVAQMVQLLENLGTQKQNANDGIDEQAFVVGLKGF